MGGTRGGAPKGEPWSNPGVGHLSVQENAGDTGG
jgi:hypothetical protein